MHSELLFKTAYFHALAAEKNEFFTAILKMFEELRGHLEEIISEMLETGEGQKDAHHPDMGKMFRLLTNLIVDFNPEATALHKAMYLMKALREILELNESIRDRIGSKHERLELFNLAMRNAVRGVVPILTTFYEQNIKTVSI